MEGSFRSPTNKRSAGANGGSRKRSKKPPPLAIPPGHAVFRLLCHASRIGGFIGKSGSVIKQLQQDTAAKIRVEEAPSTSEDRVIVIVASSALNKTITLRCSSSSVDKNVNGDVGGDDDSPLANGGDTLQASAAQEALIRVFERILEVAAETEGVSEAIGGVVSCRLLADTSQVGSLIGKGGKIIENIRNESGSKIRVSTDNLPTCTGPTEEMVEIHGDAIAVKKALVAISQRLQDFPPSDKAKLVASKSFVAAQLDSLNDMHIGAPRHSSLVRSGPRNSVTYASGLHPLSLEAERTSIMDSEILNEDVVFKILCSNDVVGGVIGKGGGIVKALQEETGALISIGPLVDECDERLITITGSENPESKYSPAQNALCLVFARAVEAGFEKGLDSSSKSTVSARLVAPSDQVGCLLGKGGAIVSEMRRATGAGIRIMGTDESPKCVTKSDQVVQITGKFVKVQDAICYVTGRLRDNILASTVQPRAETRTVRTVITPYGRTRDVDFPGIYRPYHIDSHNSHFSLRSSNNHSHDMDYPSSPVPLSSQRITGVYPRVVTDSGRGLTSFKGGQEIGSGTKSAIVTNTTIEIVVPENVIGSVYGENGSNLTRLRQVSGAKVIVHEPHPGTRDRVVIISGTPDETQAAQSLLQAFILTGPS